MASPTRSSSQMERRVSVRSSRGLSFGDEDEYDLGTMAIPDGFQSTTTTGTSACQNRMSFTTSQPGRRSVSPRRPSSTIKIRGLDPFALRHDGTMESSSEAALASNRSSITRPSSTSTAIPVGGPEGPYDGPARPSHPYQMYPQDIQIARTASVVTSTFDSSERPYRGLSDPTHPYYLYPQNTVSETVDNQPQMASIPVGFPGRNDQYQRRLGPDGEEAGDMIGPLGHTEQLPPYTKYPDESMSRRIIPTIPAGAGGIGLATRNPEFESREDLNMTESRQSVHSFASDNLLAVPQSLEKREDKKWKIIAGKKICRIVPIWIILIGAFLIGFGVIIAGVIMKRKHDENSNAHATPSPSSVIYSTVTTTFDAASLASSPTNIPLGPFALQLQKPFINLQNCLESPSFYNAWSCDMSPSNVLVSTTDPPASQPPGMEISISKPNMSTLCYGSQSPDLPVNHTMTLQNDTSQTSFGVAWHFQTTYDKLVIVPEHLLSAPSGEKRNVARNNHSPTHTRRNEMEEGDKPWFCYWNGTLLEVFIYINQANPGLPGPPSGPPPGQRLSPDQSPHDQFEQPHYPKQIKVEERRNSSLPQFQAPYCVQMVINNGTPIARVNNGVPVMIRLKEMVPMASKRNPVDLSWSDHSLAEREKAGSCECALLSL